MLESGSDSRIVLGYKVDNMGKENEQKNLRTFDATIYINDVCPPALAHSSLPNDRNYKS